MIECLHHDCHKIAKIWINGQEQQYNSTYPNAGYPDPLGRSSKFAKNYTKLTCIEVAGYRIKYSTVLWPLELQIRRGRNV